MASKTVPYLSLGNYGVEVCALHTDRAWIISMCAFVIVILVLGYEKENGRGFFVVVQHKYETFIRDEYYIILVL